MASVLQGNIAIVRYKTSIYIEMLIFQRLRCLIVLLIVEHCFGHGPVLVLRGVGEHRPNQQDADREETHRDTEQGPLGPGLGLLIVSLGKHIVVMEDMVDGKVGLLHGQVADQLHRIVKVGGDINQG